MLDEQLISRSLFGGAIEMEIPARFEDVSDFRPVPDHQEVRMCCVLVEPQRLKPYTRSANLQVWTDASLDQSLILEIVVSSMFINF